MTLASSLALCTRALAVLHIDLLPPRDRMRPHARHASVLCFYPCPRFEMLKEWIAKEGDLGAVQVEERPSSCNVLAC